jgi:hypothetical protein
MMQPMQQLLVPGGQQGQNDTLTGYATVHTSSHCATLFMSHEQEGDFPTWL